MAGQYIDFFSKYIMGSIQMLTGAYFFTKFLQQKIRPYSALPAAAFCIIIIKVIPDGRIPDFVVYSLALMAVGIFVCHTDWKSAVLYAALTVEIMQLCYGIVNSLFCILFPLMSSLNQKMVGLTFMLSGNLVSLLLAVVFYRMIYRFFITSETDKKQYLPMVLTPILLLFLMDEYINSTIYKTADTADNSGILIYANHYQMFVIQLLGIASLFCILFAYKKLLQNFRLHTELSLLEQEEHSLNRYVEEARARYEETKSFRHDIKNHITVVRELLQDDKTEQALNYIVDMEDKTEELSFPCTTNNPVVDILVGNKLGIAKSLGIDTGCSLRLPHPCFVRDIDLGIILSNALDNAIHSCKNMDGGAEKYIHVSGHLQGDFILLEVENSFQGNGSFKEGTGLLNIKTVAKKYHGSMSIKTQGASWILSVLLIIPQHPENISQQID